MKKLYIIGALALSLLSSVIILNKVNAQTSTGQLLLEIEAGGVTCDFTGSYDFGTLSAADVFETANTLTGDLGTFVCEDLRGDADWNISIQSTALTNGMLTWDIDDIEIVADANTLLSGACTVGTNTVVYTDMFNSPQVIIKKDSAENELCTIQAENVIVKVEVPENQPVGSYASVVTVDYPA